MLKKIFSLILGFIILIIIQYVSNFLIKITHIPFPSPLLGMIVLASLLYFKILPETLIKDISDLLLKNMSLFFVPLFVGIMVYVPLIKNSVFQILGIILVTTFLTMIVTAFAVEKIIHLTKKVQVDD